MLRPAGSEVVAHVFEFPGKMRLAKSDYFSVQRIYYPGFTFAGVSEPVGHSRNGKFHRAPDSLIVLKWPLLFFNPHYRA